MQIKILNVTFSTFAVVGVINFEVWNPVWMLFIRFQECDNSLTDFRGIMPFSNLYIHFGNMRLIRCPD